MNRPSNGSGAAPGERLYRLLLHLYPRAFRQRYAEDMLSFYRERAAISRSAWLTLIPDLVASALLERFAWMNRDLERAPAIVRQHHRRREAVVSILVQDIRYALRGMRRRPGFACVILATLALGIGANAAIFTVVNGVLLRPLPFAEPERIVDFAHVEPYESISEPEFVDYKRGVTAFAKLAAYSTPSILIAPPDGDATRTYAARVSGDFFDVVGTRALLGRTFAPDEFSPATHARVAVLGHRLWVQSFGADSSIVGKVVTINGGPVTVIGVMPDGFTFPDVEASLWLPWRLNPDSLWTRNNHYLRMVGKLADGATLSQARAQVQTLDQRWMTDFPETYAADRLLTATLRPIADHLLGPTRPYLLALLGAVGFILLIACVNVANLLLVRGEARRKELAIRTALGASRSRMVRQLLTESLVLATIGACAGMAVAWVGTQALIALAPGDLPRVDQIGIDMRVVAFTIAITIATGVIFGAVPALRLARGDSAETLRDGGKTSSVGASRAARRALVVAEIALAVMMLSGAGLLVRSLLALRAIDLGFSSDGVLTMQVTMPRPKYNDTSSDEFMRQLIARVRAVPGVDAASAVSYLPISGSDNGWSILTDTRPASRISDASTARPENVMPDYFRALLIRVVRGRVFTEQDRMGAAPVAVISEGMAKELWPGMDPIGHRLKMFNDASAWATIVGVVADVRARGFQGKIPPTMYLAYSQSAQTAYGLSSSMTLVVRARSDASGGASALVPSIRRIIRELDAAVPISQVATMDQVVGNSIASRRFTTALLAGFALLALVLAGIGIYGVISFGVSQRRSEIGIRVAMGASPMSIVRLVAGEGGRMTAIGLACGLTGTLLVVRLIRTMLVQVSATDAPTLAAVIGLLAFVAIAACVVPVRRATAVSPTEALRDG